MRVTQSWLAIGATQISVNRLLPGRVTSALAPARHRERDISQQHSLSSYSYCSASGGALRDKLIIQLGKFIAMWVTYRMLQAEADALRIGKFGWRIHAPLFLGGYNKRAPCQSMFTVTFCYMIHMIRMCGCAFFKSVFTTAQTEFNVVLVAWWLHRHPMFCRRGVFDRAHHSMAN